MTAPRARSTAVVMTVGVLVTLVLGAIGAFGWLWWVWSETPAEVRGSISPARRNTVIAAGIASMLACVVGLALTVLGLVRSFRAVAGVAPEDKARMLAEGISEAMNATVVGLVALGLGVILAFVAGFRLLHASARVRA